MRKSKCARACLLVCAAMSLTLCGCWDQRELDTLAIVTGMGLDVGGEPDAIDVTLQVGDFQSAGGAGGGGAGEEPVQSSVILVEQEEKTILSAIDKMRCKSTRNLFLHHNQMIVISQALAEKGLEDETDFFLRNIDARLEVNLYMVEGDVKAFLSAVPENEDSTALALSGMMDLEQKTAPGFGVNCLRFISNIISKTISSAVPIVKAQEQDNGKSTISFDGMALFSDGKMVGRLDEADIPGFLWLYDGVMNKAVTIEDQNGTASIRIEQETPKVRAYFDEAGGVVFDAQLDGNAAIGEMQGFSGMEMTEVAASLQAALNREMEARCQETFKKTQDVAADIYEVGEYLYQHDPKRFLEIKPRWTEVYPQVTLKVHAKLQIKTTGQAGKSLEMGG
ncbi:MAG: Ger(x)C family spore germination protein [Oscillospiraceae bacterium]